MNARRILMVAEMFPPHNVSGAGRPYGFAKYLPERGYVPVVLSSEVPVGAQRDDALLDALSPEVEVLRTPLWVPAMRHAFVQRVKGKKPLQPSSAAPKERVVTRSDNQLFRHGSALWRATGLPMWLLDWYVDWAPQAVWSGYRAGRKHRVELVWATSPNPRALLIGAALAKLLRVPLVLDLRDPWTYGSVWTPRGELSGHAELALARSILSQASRVVFTSPLTQAEMEKRHPVLVGKSVTITNGFEGDADDRAERGVSGDVCLFRHVGMLNRRRTPRVLLDALERACELVPEMRKHVHLEFVGEMSDHLQLLREHSVSELVSARGRVGKADAVALMRGADVNVLLQTIATGTDVIAGKTFDYLAAQRPILAAVSESGGDAWLLRRTGGHTVVPYDRPESIAGAFVAMWKEWRAGTLSCTSAGLEQFDRRVLTGELARLFDDVLAG